jgi:hypothetical protein
MRGYFVVIWSSILILTTVGQTQLSAGGISVDAGLTPAKDRWIVRSQIRKSDSTSTDKEMQMWMVPIVVAYGLRSDTTVMVRQKFIKHKMRMKNGTKSDTGISDLFILGKYKAYRLNHRDYIFAIATTLGVEFPTGDEAFSSNSLDIQPGLILSYRRGLYATDFSISYKINGKDKKDINLGDELEVDLALAYQFIVANRSDMSLTPVLEFSHKQTGKDSKGANTEESLLYISPGIKWTISSTIIEGLVQIPISQNKKGAKLKRDTSLLFGFRHMF